MSESLAQDSFAMERLRAPQPDLTTSLPPVAQYGLVLVFVALATGAAFVVQTFIVGSNLALVYVLPVIYAANLFGWLPSLAAVFSGVAAFDFFFTEPRYSLAMTNPPEIWAVVMLLIIATIVASVSAQSRRRAIEASIAAERAEALHILAHAVMTPTEREEIWQVAALALNRIFQAPAVIFVQRDGDMRVFAKAGGGPTTEEDEQAARGVLSSQLSTRGETYPYDRTYFDLWPVPMGAGRGCVFGVDFVRSARERPPASDRIVESVAGYVTAALARG